MRPLIGLIGAGSCVSATGILLYVSMTTGIGPWFGPTIVLCAGMIFYLLSSYATHDESRRALVDVQTIGSVGGAMATAVGFSLTTLHFLQKDMFAAWLARPVSFSLFLTFFTLAAGLLGAVLARFMRPQLLEDDSYSFPVSTVLYETIVSQAQAVHAKMLGLGASCAAALGVLRDGIGRIPPLIPKVWQVFSGVGVRHFAIDTMPVYWAIGYLAGFAIVSPLIVGLISKYLVVWPLNNHARYLGYALFQPLKRGDFVLAFCSGIVLVLALLSLRTYPQMIRSGWLRLRGSLSFKNLSDISSSVSFLGSSNVRDWYDSYCRWELVVALCASSAVLTYLSFSWMAQIIVIALAVLADYQMAVFAARTGLATYGRFMTFVMIPMIALFQTSDIQTTFVCVFVGVVGAVATNQLFSYKLGQLVGVSERRVHLMHVFGVVISALSIGWIFWLIAHSLSIGSPALVAHRGLTRALLLRSYQFNYYVLALGGLYGLFLRAIRVNPMLVFGGLVMPNSMIIGLGLGALARFFTHDHDRYTPFWSGVFAGYSLWMFLVMMRAFF